MTFKDHVKQWSNCTACDLCGGRRSVVLARGKLPCDVLFVGEAPGESEDVMGYPFAGPAGKLLDKMVRLALADCLQPGAACLRMAYTNLVACIPREDGRKAGEPPKAAIKACAPRLAQLGKLASPKLLVCVGQLTAKHAPEALQWPKGELPLLAIVHPTAILRASVAQQSFAIERCIVQLKQAFDDLLEGTL